jgi:hypothetical protein
MKAFIQKALFFLRITDEDGLLSITHIACWVVIAKIALDPNPSISEMGGLLVTLALYYGKKHLDSKKKKLNDEQTDALAKMQAKVDQVADKVGAVATTLGFSKRT